MQWLGTFHSIGAKMLRRNAELVELKSDFTILDTDDQIRLMKQIITAANVDEKRWPARQLAGLIDHWKNRGLAPEDVPDADGRSFADGRGKALYAAYQARLRTLNAADFGDLMLLPLQIMKHNPDVLADYHARFRYMLVDEYQDTNVAQYLWLRLLAQEPVTKPAGATPREDGKRAPPNICCVGDDDQSIYGWRGAEVDNILRFEKDFPGAKVIRLERNYRSTPHILGAASHLIAHNEGRLGKTLFTDAKADSDMARVSVASSWDFRTGSARHRRGDRAAPARRAYAERNGDIGARLVPDARLRRSLRDARAELPRHRRAAVLRAAGNPRCAGVFPRHRLAGRRPGVRAHHQYAAPGHRRDEREAAARSRAGARHAADGGGAGRGGDGRAGRAHARLAPRSAGRVRALARAARNAEAYGPGGDYPRRERLHRDVAGRPLAPTRRGGSKT